MSDTILVPVDFDDASRRAVDHALSLASVLRCPVRILHVVPPTSFPEGTRLLPVDASEPVDVTSYVSERARRLLDETFVEVLAHGVEVAREARSGHAVETILRTIAETGATLVVMGTHGRKGFDRAVLGSVAEEVLRRSPVPVLVVPSPTEDAVPQGHMLAGATTLSGAVAGAALGAIAGPPGAIAGGAVGSLVGAVAGRAMEREELRASTRDRELDDTIGVTRGSLGVPPHTKKVGKSANAAGRR